jgi:hypothetical protein
MQGFGKEYRVYADNGLRSAEAWQALGRELHPGSKPRCSLEVRGAPLDLFSRDQTHLRRQAQPSE